MIASIFALISVAATLFAFYALGMYSKALNDLKITHGALMEMNELLDDAIGQSVIIAREYVLLADAHDEEVTDELRSICEREWDKYDTRFNNN